ncbi:acyltransferase family protein [Ilumatobacter sp.]|uniref:acyltransferase family protein n=1 Tax=Ilumatobacter sp. TaxID=1967498 RepID=UPI003C6F630E
MGSHVELSDIVGQPHGGRFAALEGYRGLAAMGVLIFHTAARTGFDQPDRFGSRVIDNLGNFSVSVFFLLSGFLLYRPFCSAAIEQSALPARGRFLIRRFVRIYPAYWVVLIAWALTATSSQTAPSNPLAIFLLIDPYVPPIPAFSGLGVAWSLSIEIGFYLFVPVAGTAMFWLSKRIDRRRRRMTAQLVLLATMYLTAMFVRYASYTWGSPIWASRWLPSYLDWFALGMLLALAVAWTDGMGRIPQAMQRFADSVGVCFACAAVAYLSIVAFTGESLGLEARRSTEGALVRAFFQGMAAFFVLLPAVVGRNRDHPLFRALRRPVLASLGVISYGVYLWHQTVLAQMESWWSIGIGFWPFVTSTVVAGVLTVVIATLSYRLIETPAMELGRGEQAATTPRSVPLVS